MKLYFPKWYRLLMRGSIGFFGLAMTLAGFAFLATTIWPSIIDQRYPPPTATEAWVLRIVGACFLLGGPFIVYAAITKPFGFRLDDA